MTSAAQQIADTFYSQTVQVETYLGTTNDGVRTFATAVPVACFLSNEIRKVTDPNGEEVVSGSSLSTLPDNAALLVPFSRVTVETGQVTTVITRRVSRSGALDLPDHCTVFLT